MPDPITRDPSSTVPGVLVASGAAARTHSKRLGAVEARVLTPVRRRAIRDGLTLVGFLGVLFPFGATVAQGGGADTGAFWDIHKAQW